MEQVPAQDPEYDARLTRHFLTGEELTGDELNALVERALELKADRLGSRTLEGKSVALVFERPSTRTRVSFQVGVAELGGNPVVLREGELQLERGESIRDTALVLSRYVHAIGVRTGPQATLEELAAYATVPVINMLTYEHHPCQVLADLVTLRELFGRLEGVKLAYVGDGNNMARSLVLLGRAAGVEVAVASPPELALPDGPNAELDEAVAGADAIYTDVWVSMGDEQDASAAASCWPPTGSTSSCWSAPATAPWRCTACPRTPARRSARECSTASAPPSGTRPRTGCTPRRPCSSCSFAAS